MRMRRRGRSASETGSVLVEAALALPLFVSILIITTDFARVFYLGMSLTAAARAGAQYGAGTVQRSGDTATIQATALAATNVTGITATATRVCECATNAGVFSATLPGANNCHSPQWTACTGGTHRVMTVRVTTSKAFRTIIGAVPGVPNPLTVTRLVTMRVVQ
jgi:hypothetical protein